MRNRNVNGQFIARDNFADVVNVWNLLLLLFRMLPILLVLYSLFHYFHIKELMFNILISFTCGSKSCSCKCENGGKDEKPYW